MLSCATLEFDGPRPLLYSSPESAPAGEKQSSTGESRWGLPVVGKGGERNGQGRGARDTMSTDSMDGLDCQGERSRAGRERYERQKNGGERGAGNSTDAGIKGLSRRTPLRPFVVHLYEQASQAPDQVLRMGEKVFIFQPPEKPGGTWKEMQAVVWVIEKNLGDQMSLKYRVDPRVDSDMAEGCPVFKEINGHKILPVGIHLGRYADVHAYLDAAKLWTHHGLLLTSGLRQIAEWWSLQRTTNQWKAVVQLEIAKTSHRKVLRERTKALISRLVSATADGQDKVKEWDNSCYQKKLLELSPEDAEALAEACEERGVPAVLAVLTAAEGQATLPCMGLKALARLASKNHQTLLEIGRLGGVEVVITVLRKLGESRQVQEDACKLLTLLSHVAEFNRCIGTKGGCEEVLEILRRCATFGGACPCIQSWALGCVANLLASGENRRKLLTQGVEGPGEEVICGLAGWVHTLFSNSERVANDRDAQYAAIACVHDIISEGSADTDTPAVVMMASTGVPRLIGAAVENFGATDAQIINHAKDALRRFHL